MDTHYLGKQLLLINILCRNLVQKKTAGFDLRHGQLPLLEAAMDHPGSTQQELAEMLRVTPASIAQSAARLQRAGLIEKHIDPNNKRCNRLTATVAGRQAAALYRRSFDEVNDFMFSGLSEAQLTDLSGLFDTILKNFGEDAAMIPCPPDCNKEEPQA